MSLCVLSLLLLKMHPLLKCRAVKINEKWRLNLAFALVAMNVFQAIFGLLIFLLSLHLTLSFNEYSMLLDDYKSSTVIYFFAVLGTLTTTLHGLGIKLSFSCLDVERRDGVQSSLLPYIFVKIVASLFTLSTATGSLLQSQPIEDALNGGLKLAMSRYKSELPVKVIIDKLQMAESCCGSKSYKDWYNVGWISTEFVDSNNPIIKR